MDVQFDFKVPVDVSGQGAWGVGVPFGRCPLARLLVLANLY